MKNTFLRTVIIDFFLILGGSTVGVIALLLVHLLPVNPMQEHVYWSLPMIEKEFEDEIIVQGYQSTLTGNFTDCLMLENAVYQAKNHSLLEQVMLMYRAESYEFEDGWWPGYSLKDYLQHIPQAREVEYARYWHGYLVILKPLLLLTSFNTIRLLNSAVQLLLIGCIIMGICKKNALPLAMSFILSLPFLFFVSTFASLSLSICFYIMAVFLLIQLRFHNYFCEKGLYNMFFLIIGMATSYFDFLTYPLITLGFPLCVYLYFRNKNIKNSFCKIFQYSIQWFVGYMGLWVSKWVLADLLTGNSTIQDAVNTLMTRTYSAAGYSRITGFFTVLRKNIQPYGNWCYVIIAGVAVIMLSSHIRRENIKYRNIKKMIPFLFLALYPLIWFFVTQNHSEQHWQYTCRIFACSIFAGYAGCAKIGENQDELGI